ncbi:hypothetical protein RvY_07210 [Ramazzottius varieornatus]|uniref:Uncharacterized protein n=1 Tax=Ramazzottius varieornatus TaxID=947166 RepID=A0A1D1V1J0_RAMVA|nr:hypothetical protein RvY_07210 [Ramazzottius varieornatus]
MPRDVKDVTRIVATPSTAPVPIKRGPGRPPKNPPAVQVQATPLTSLPPGPRQPATFHGRSGEARKEIGNCGSREKKRGRGRPPLKRPAVQPDSESEDDIPATFSDVVKLIIQKVQETQREINTIEESYDNYKKHCYSSTVLAMRFYAAVPQLHERVAAGASFDDDLLESVFAELFPQNGDVKKKPPGQETTTPGKISEHDDTKRLAQSAEKGRVDRESHAGSRSPRRSSRTH